MFIFLSAVFIHIHTMATFWHVQKNQSGPAGVTHMLKTFLHSLSLSTLDAIGISLIVLCDIRGFSVHTDG